MKIHIVRKGDTLWEIAKQYGVDFEELKKFNSQLSSPDMIMPGMKIKIPGTTKSVKKETTSVKETKVPIAKEAPKQSPVIQEDDHKKPKEVKVETPKEYIPEKPSKPLGQKKEVPIMKEPLKTPAKPIKEAPIKKEAPKTPVKPVKPMKEMIKMPVIEEEAPMTLPETSQPKKTKKPKKHKEEQVPSVAPIYHHYYHHCCAPPYHPCYPVMGEMTGGFMPHHQMHQGHKMKPIPLQPQGMMQPHDCGCQGKMPQYQMREQTPAPAYVENPVPFGYHPYMADPQMQPLSREVPAFQMQPNFTNGLNTVVEKPFPMPPTYPRFSEYNIQEGKQVQQTKEDDSPNK